MRDLMPIDGAYFASAYFMVTTIVSICVAVFGAYITEGRDE